MVQFATPQPITATIDVPVADVLVIASDRADTVVTVTPSRDTAGARRLAESVRVDCRGGHLDVRSPLSRVSMVWLSGRDSVDVVVELPAWSSVEVSTGAGRIETRGELARTGLRTGAGNILVEHSSDVDARTSAGNIDVRAAEGDVRANTAAGHVRLGAVDGEVTAKTSAGDLRVERAGGALSAKTAAGRVVVGRADGDVQIASSYGDVTIGALARGLAEVKTSHGEVRVGVRPGTAAWVDATTSYGRVETDLAQGADAAASPEAADRLELRVRTGFGDVRVSRATADGDGVGASR